MKVNEAIDILNQMLDQAKVDMASPQPIAIWNIFKQFVQQPVACADEGVLFQCGVFNFTGEYLFYFDFVRQFTIEIDGEYHHMEQLHCEFTSPSINHFKSLGSSNTWAYDFASLKDFFEEVETLKEFQVGREHCEWKLKIFQHKV